MLEGEWVEVRGDDAELYASGQAEAIWRQATSSKARENQHHVFFKDADFPPEPSAIDGQRHNHQRQLVSKDSVQGTRVESRGPSCRCRLEARRDTVRKEGPTKGRPYWHCATRECGFFCWADRVQVQPWEMTWRRFNDFVVVTDFGFRAADLRQGGVGDCWFLSALAVVAERHDLILRIFAGGCTASSSGCYLLRFFLDGRWNSVVIDDMFPCTDKQRRPDGTGLAYSRADRQQLWVPLVEKAYAKSHGSYKAISGGHVAEALHDLTGAPVESIDFDAPGFDPEDLWQRLLFFRRSGFPMGCGTVGNPELEQVGLYGMHAYSILDIREVRDSRQTYCPPELRSTELQYGRAKDACTLRLVRLRNPHGMGEWTGDWSDRSVSWTPEIASQLISDSIDGQRCTPTGLEDGTFWMDYPHFLSAFHDVEVCKAYRGWHARSFDNVFCARSEQALPCVCRNVFLIRLAGANNGTTSLYISALQPTKRGAWCREDRQKSYRLGDISLALLRLDTEDNCSPVDWKPISAVAGGLFGTKRDNHVYCELREADATYLLLCFSFGHGPYAAAARDAAPFRVRFYSSQPLIVRTQKAGGVGGNIVAAALHLTLLRLASCQTQQQPCRNLGPCLKVFLVQGEGCVALYAANDGHDAAQVRIAILAVGMAARTGAGLLPDLEASNRKTTKPKNEDFKAGRSGLCFACGKKGHYARDCPTARNGIRGAGWGRWGPPVEKRYVSLEVVPPSCQRLLMVIVQSGQSWGLQALEVESSQTSRVSSAAADNDLHLEPAPVPVSGLFAPQPFNRDAWQTAQQAASKVEDDVSVVQSAPEVSMDVNGDLESAMRESKKLLALEEKQRIQAALAASNSLGQTSERLSHVSMPVVDLDVDSGGWEDLDSTVQASCQSLAEDEARQLRHALAASAALHPVLGLDSIDLTADSGNEEEAPQAKRARQGHEPCTDHKKAI